MWAKVRAQNWLHAYDGRVAVNTFLYPDDSIGGNTMRKALEGGISSIVGTNGVYPNPARTDIEVVYSVQNDKGIAPVFELRDLMGRIVLQQTLSNSGRQHFSVTSLPVSAYLYRISEAGETKMSGKLIRN